MKIRRIVLISKNLALSALLKYYMNDTVVIAVCKKNIEGKRFFCYAHNFILISLLNYLHVTFKVVLGVDMVVWVSFVRMLM